MSKTVQLRISTLRRDDDVQSRVEIDRLKVDEYAKAMRRGETFPPITVFFDGKNYWVSDGFHRVPAAENAGQKKIEAEVREGTKRDAILYSVSCNSTHGLPRTRGDKWRAVETLLNDDEWRAWSDRVIARHCCVAWSFVGRVRASICAPSTDAREVKFTRNGKHHWQRVRHRKMGRIAPEAMEILRDNPIADSRDEMKRLASKAPEHQVRIARQLALNKARTVTAASFKVKKEERLVQLRKDVPALKMLGRHRTLVIDPPWPMPPGGRLSAMHHYELMSIDEIRALPIAEVAAPDSHLYLWVVESFLREGLDLLEEWGFTRRNIITWVKTDNKGKPQLGSGHYFRSCSEYLLFGVRGNAPAKRHDLPNVLLAPRGRHSEKPDEAYELVECMSDGPYIDMFGRRKRAGWNVWGNEVGLLTPEEKAA